MRRAIARWLVGCLQVRVGKLCKATKQFGLSTPTADRLFRVALWPAKPKPKTKTKTKTKTNTLPPRRARAFARPITHPPCPVVFCWFIPCNSHHDCYATRQVPFVGLIRQTKVGKAQHSRALVLSLSKRVRAFTVHVRCWSKCFRATFSTHHPQNVFERLCKLANCLFDQRCSAKTSFLRNVPSKSVFLVFLLMFGIMETRGEQIIFWIKIFVFVAQSFNKVFDNLYPLDRKINKFFPCIITTKKQYGFFTSLHFFSVFPLWNVLFFSVSIVLIV